MISIIIPTYNGEKTIGNTLDAIFNTNKSNFEVIVINDGSKDNTIDVLNKYKNKYPNLLLIDKENTGVSDSRNIGIKTSSGEYIMFCDDDDIYEPGVIDAVSKNISQYNPDYISFGRIDINGKNKYYCSDNQRIELYEDINDFLITRFCSGYTTFSVCNKVFNNKIIKDNNICFNRDIKLSEDLDFNLKYFEYIRNIVIENNKINYIRFCNNNSTVYSRIDDYFEKSIVLLEQLEEKSNLNNKGIIFKNLKSHYCIVSLNRLFCGQDGLNNNYKIFKIECLKIYNYLNKNSIKLQYRENKRNYILFGLFTNKLFLVLYIIAVKIGNIIRKWRNL